MSHGPVIFSVGHGGRDLAAFLELLRPLGLRVLVDIRSRPRSKRLPHFCRKPLAEALAEIGVRYVFAGEDLGGLRKQAADSRHTALAPGGLRAYADYMESERFRAAASRLLELARAEPLAVMCAERFPGDCHRSLLADYLLLRGAAVRHAIDPGRIEEHRLSALARIDAGVLVYDAGRGRQLGLGF
ncbi:MAG: DUF488 domain-containing protein [Planctomycetes bacterium]|nr:DUF488 domain-containing protein [Planctomycetota bacterium]